MVRAKFKVTRIVQDYGGPAYVGCQITLTTQYDPSIPEDVGFNKATPNGTITMSIDNPRAIAALPLGRVFYVDFNEVPEVAEKA